MTDRIAIVTGASSGIGEGFARRLDLDGWRLVLVARRRDRLERLASELRPGARVVSVDLATPEGRDRLWAVVEELGEPPELLVNNAGAGLIGAFVELSRERQLELVRINVEAATDLAHRFIASRTSGGSLINVASIVGLRPVPTYATYGATKAYLVSLSLALSVETAARGLRVLALCPGPVPTGFQAIAGSSLDGIKGKLAISVEQVVEEALAALERGDPLCVPGAKVRWLSRLLGLVPQSLGVRLATFLKRPAT